MLLGIDHLVIAAVDPDQAADRLADALGLYGRRAPASRSAPSGSISDLLEGGDRPWGCSWPDDRPPRSTWPAVAGR
jgi:hypothetical protein